MVVITGPNGEEVIIQSHGPVFKTGEEFLEEFKKHGCHCLADHDCEGLPPHYMCWEDASGMFRWED